MITAEAAEQVWDAIIVGAGPAGAAAGCVLATAGRSVLILERATWPRWKVCGGCLSGRGAAALARLGLPQTGEPLHQFSLYTAGRRRTLPLTGYHAVARTRFDATLIDAARAHGAAWLEQCSALATELDATTGLRSLRVRAADGAESLLQARLILIASGLGSAWWLPRGGDVASDVAPGSRLGAGALAAADSALARHAAAHYGAGTIHMLAAAGGYLGLAWLPGGDLDLAAAFDPQFVRSAGSLGAAAEAVCATAGAPLLPGLRDLTWKGTPPLTRRHVPAAERLLVVGDAAGYIEPFTGEGMGWALEDGLAAGELAAAALDTSAAMNALPAAWTRRQAAATAGRSRLCRAAAWLLHRPRVASAAFALLTTWPALFAMVNRELNSAARPPSQSRAWSSPR